MKESIIFDEHDENVIRLFTDLGMSKNLAKTLLYVSQVEECQATDIESATNLRQPEVSIAMQELRKRGWVNKRDHKRGKGRPIHVYTPTISLDDIITNFEEEKIGEIHQIQGYIDELQRYKENKKT